MWSRTGAAIVDGKPHVCTVAGDVTVPAASGAGNTRIDRIVLRASWAAQTVRLTRIAGTDAASPTAPGDVEKPEGEAPKSAEVPAGPTAEDPAVEKAAAPAAEAPEVEAAQMTVDEEGRQAE